MKLQVTNFKDFNEAVQAMSEVLRNDPDAIFNLEFEKADKKMTPTQQGSLHLYCEHVASALNDAGMTVEMTMKHFNLPWSKMLVKELLWKQTLKLVNGKKSTMEQTTAEPSEIYDIVNLHLSTKGIHVAWPDRFTRMDKVA